MLEIKNLTKIYKPKKGVPVTALDGVTLKFPEKGMIFLLGKSGSGKSTLLNLLGGLDSYDDGEILIKGVSSRDFTQSRFDSYRNTYVGFIFQEYNVLPEFTVGANIALALELQGKKATDEEINGILERVDLADYGNRRPNELSGGQLQRVAIARALVKNPEIIMADEPTGALDSNTGKQVFDTLKKLASDKLVIIVSHDREYAEHYADRIIELADGRVIDDVEYDRSADENIVSLEYEGDTVKVPKGYHLTEEDRVAINAYIDSLSGKAMIRFAGRSKKFRKTDESVIKAPNPVEFKLIKSKLPMKSAFKIGAGGLKHKKFRLALTILLSVVAFTLFALVDTFSAYDHVETCTTSIMDSEINYASVIKSKRIGEGIDSYWRTWGYKLTENDLDSIKDASGVELTGVYVPDSGSLDITGYISQDRTLFTDSNFIIHSMTMSGFAELTEADIEAIGYEVSAGRMPEKDGEIAITSYVCETFKIGGFVTGVSVDENGFETVKYEKIDSDDDMIGKKLTLAEREYTVVGVVDTKFDLSRYEALTEKAENDSTADQLVDYFLYNELEYAKSYSFHNLAIVCEGAVDALVESGYRTQPLNAAYLYFYVDGESYTSIDPYRVGKYSDLELDRVIWADGKAPGALGEKDIVVTADCVYADMSFVDDSVAPEITEDGEVIYKTDYSALFDLEFYGHANTFDDFIELDGYRIVGIIDNITDPVVGESPTSVYVCDSFYNKLTADAGGTYSFAVGVMPEKKADIKTLVEYCYSEDSDVRYPLQNSVTYELDTVNEVLEMLSSVFFWIGLGFAIFASVMLANFIGTSIAYKKREIGILRAIGSRSNDVFRIFFSESFIIAMINFVLATAATLTLTAFINATIREEAGLLITILTFGIRQIFLLFVISVGVAAISSFLPVRKIASKRPIDAIRDR